MTSNKTLRRLVAVVLILLIILLFSVTRQFLSPLYDTVSLLINPLILAIYIFYAFRPIRNKLTEWTKKPKLSAVVTFLLFIVLAIGLFYVTFSMIYDQAQSFLNDLDLNAIVQYSNSELYQEINQYIPLNSSLQKLESWLQGLVTDLPNILPTIFSNIGTFGSLILLVILGLFYLLVDENQAVKAIHSLAQGKYYDRTMDILGQIHETLKIYISGQILVACILGILMFIGYAIIGLKYKLSLAAIAFLFNFIPFIGPFIAAAPAVLVGLTMSPSMVIKVIVVSIVTQQLEGNIITPNIMGSKLDIHPFIVIVAVMVCANLFGVLGALIASPLYMCIKIIVTGIRSEKYDDRAPRAVVEAKESDA
ncbi:MAG: AI-2E family transporter [Peptoniphilus sp.]|nr:AI-2E family transporter [Peptoniphilus sp.]MDD7363264.1 AI-2E family transporter [Bacillota bacterium]MDY6045357.1 AI-2E family transporter [Peptoniphilus sp.]